MKQLVIIALVAVGGFLVWNYVPGVRTAFADAKDKLTEWSDEDRKDRPAEYIAYARTKLEGNIEKYQDLMGEIDTLQSENKAKEEEHARIEKGANDLLEEARVEFAAAEANGSWPIEFKGTSYTKEKFITAVESWMGEKTNATRQLESYGNNLSIIAERKNDLRTRVQNLQNAIADLDTKEATLKVAALSEADNKLLADVDNLLKDSTEALTDNGLPSVKDILAKDDAEAAAKAKAAEMEASKTAVIDFLNS